MLITYTYPNNIRKYFNKKSFSDYSDELIESISGSFSQAYEYFEAFKNSTLNISPLLLYYGTTNLFNGVANLTSCKVNLIENHGMKIKEIPEELTSIGNLKITPVNPAKGALSVFAKTFGVLNDICSTSKWSLTELFSSIPFLLDDFLECYENEPPHILPVIDVKKPVRTERIKTKYFERFSDKITVFQAIEGFKENYINFQPTNECIVLRKKLMGKDIYVYDIAKKKYLAVGHKKNGQLITLPIEIVLFMGLYALGFISRYRPALWNPFVKNDVSGEKLFIENFLNKSARIIPNLMLNKIYNENLFFDQNNREELDYSMILSEEKIREIVKKEVIKNEEVKRWSR
jgi:hypothetical protein